MGVETRHALVLAAISLMAVGALLVLFPSGASGDMQDGAPTGVLPATVLGIVAFLGGMALLVFGMMRSLRAGPREISAPTPEPVPQEKGESSAPSSEVEAAIVRLLDDSERLLYLRLRDEDSKVLQRDIVSWGTFSAAKVSRLLERLEMKGLIVRERLGMTNRVRLTHRPLVPEK